MKRRLVSVLAAAGIALTALLAPQAPAQAASYGWVYISYPKWLGNCESGGQVTGIQAYTDYWSTTWDFGDDLVYGKVALGQRNNIYATVYCNKWPGYYRYVFRNDVVPTRSGQTVWLGPGGWTRN